ncbi:DUF4406 domain-containing protein [Desulfosporosinus metallidurans]|uniref:DUF7768 domain-containing protein n=1 Tax=Desulfosporosinus metallidurans TaxID=1888891 RepID=A0A1Q8QGU6_9FIRM|nr:DUF4406 domain-containing protein [Desulfosporosinus metallidurans]OLN26573.1 hypothetical protein DSOL_4924 [Desulfosporosinus metallidurans]
MKLVYICSPLRGVVEENIKKANRYCEYAAGCDTVPLAPHAIFTAYLQDNIPKQREKGLEMGLALLRRCDEMWCCGDEITQGMQGEIDLATKLNIPIVYVLDHHMEEGLKIRQENKALDTEDCIPRSNEMDYEDKILVLNPEALMTSRRTAENSLWIAYNGFGCTFGARGQAVYAKSLFSGQECRWERADFLGIVKPESLKQWLENTPVKNEIAETLINEQEQHLEMTL